MTLACRVTLPLGRFVLDVDFESAHRVTGIFGRSGAGKSSLLEAIIGLRPATKGRIALDGSVWLDTEAKRSVRVEHRDVGYVPQAGLLFPNLTVQENLATGIRRARARGLDVDALREQAIDALALRPLVRESAQVLSGGERQRVALARALCSGPRLLVLDEPLASLDAAMQRALLPFIHRVRETFDIPMLLVSHAPLEVATLCDHVIALDEGKIVARGTPTDVLASSAVLPSTESSRRSSVFPIDDIDASGAARIARTDVRIATRATVDDARTSWLVIPADAVILSRSMLYDSTASNVLPVRVVQIDPQGDYDVVHVTLAPGHPPLLVEITHASCLRLGITLGTELTAIIKATSIERL